MYEILGDCLGALIGGGITGLVAWRVFTKTSADLEATELRLQKTKCIIAISGLRWVLSDLDMSLEEQARIVGPFKAQFATEFNKIMVLWSDDADVMIKMRDFDQETEPSRRTDRLIELLKALGSSATIATHNLADADLRRTFNAFKKKG